MSKLNQPNLVGMAGDSLREAFGKAITKLAITNKKVVVLDGDIAGGTGAHHFRKAHPNRFFQFGIAEQNMMSAAAGMASVGLIPFVTTFAAFSLRAIEQARLSVAYANYNVKIVASHPGLDTGPDGASAQALEDLAAFRAIPNMVVLSPADPLEMELAIEAVIKYDGPVYLRSGRSPATRIFEDDHKFQIGKGTIVTHGNDVAIIACGVQVARAIMASDILKKMGVSARVINMPSIKPLDADLLLASAREIGAFVVTEDHSIYGGLCGAVSELLAQECPTPCHFVAVDDLFGESGEPEQLAEKYGLSAPYLVEAAMRVIKLK